MIDMMMINIMSDSILKGDKQTVIDILDYSSNFVPDIEILYLGEGSNEFQALNLLENEKNNLYYINSLNKKENFLFLNRRIVHDIKNHRDSELTFNHSILLDSNLMGDILVLFKQRNLVDQKQMNTYQLLLALLKKNLDFSSLPYILKTSQISTGSKIPLYENLAVYLMLMEMTSEDLENFIHQQEGINWNKFDWKDIDYIYQKMKKTDLWLDQYVKLRKIIEAMLLKTVELDFDKTLKTKEKIKRFIDFCDKELCVFLEIEMIICYQFLAKEKNKQVNKFFEKVQMNSLKNEKIIHGMSWDLFHYRMMFYYMLYRPKVEDIDIHYFVSYDIRFSELLNEINIKALIFYKENVFPIFDPQMDEVIKEIDIQKYFNEDDRERRKNMVQTVNLDKIIEELKINIQL